MAVKVEPTPSVLSTDTWPPSKVASLRTSGSPRPVPRTRFCTGLSSWVNSSKMRSWSSAAMPIPVSATEQTTDAPSGVRRAVTRISPRSVNFSAFERKLRRICDTLPSSVCRSGTSSGSSNTRATDSFTSSGRSMPRRAREEVLEIELRRPHDRLARLHRREVEQVVHQLGQVVGGLADIAHLPALLRGERAVAVVEQERRQRQHRVQRRAELVAHVRQKARLELVGAPQRIRLLVELGVERDHAAVGVLELGVEARQLLLALAELLERADQLLVLLADLLDRTLRRGLRQRARERPERGGAERGRSPREQLADRHGRPLADRRRHLEPVDQAPCARHAQPHARRRPVPPREDGVHVGDPRAAVAHADHQELRRALRPRRGTRPRRRVRT